MEGYCEVLSLPALEEVSDQPLAVAVSAVGDHDGNELHLEQMKTY